jgi:anti-sigma regulatory factor (Ser/Thr protein kinase)
MDNPAGQRTPGTGPRAGILGSVTIPGIPEQVSGTRAFIARVLDRLPGVDRDAATLLTSELVTNAILHTGSGAPGGTVTVVVIGVPAGVLVEVIDDGSAGTPMVKGDLYATEGQGLLLVQQLATQWGYLRDDSGTTVWFHLAAAGDPSEPDREPRNLHRLAASAATPAAWTASSMPAQMPARSSSPVT